MPDENLTPVWASQIPQDNQAITNQAWDDFVLDFWDEKNDEETRTSSVEIDSLVSENQGIKNQESEEEMISTNLDLNSEDLFGENEETNEATQWSSIKIEGEEETQWEVDNDFDISLDDDTSLENIENKNISGQELLFEQNEDKEDEIKDNQEQESISEEDEKLDQKLEDNEEDMELNLKHSEEEINHDNAVDTVQKWDTIEETNDEQFALNDEQYGEDNENYNEVLQDDTEINSDDEVISENDNEIRDENNETNLPDSFDNEEIHLELLEDNKEWEDVENLNIDQKEDYNKKDDNESEILNANQDAEMLTDSDTETFEDNAQNDGDLNESIQENISEESDDFVDDNLSENKNNAQDIMKEDKSKKLDFLMDVNESENEGEEEVKQPEISDLLWDDVLDFSSEEVQNNKNEQELIPENDKKEDLDFSIWSFETSKQWLESVDSKNEDVEKNLIEDPKIIIEPSQHSDNGVQEILNKGVNNWENVWESGEPTNLDTDNQTLTQSGENENNRKEVINSKDIIDDSNKSENNGIVQTSSLSTLSLDQILDSELSSNPKFAENSKAVPKNVQKSSWLFSNKRMVWIISWVLLFLLAWFVAVMAFPSKSSERKPWDVELWTWVIIEDQSHSSWPESRESDEDVIEAEKKEIEQIPSAWSTVQLFPDADEWDDRSEEIYQLEPSPYVCEDDDCLEDEWNKEIQLDSLEVNDVIEIISKFKTQAESYYALWDDMQDKKLVKYAAQAVNLCDTYQTEVEAWEWVNQESLESFRNSVKKLISKMEEYLGWESEVEIFTRSNFYEDYDFEGKEEVREYINNRAKGLQ